MLTPRRLPRPDRLTLLAAAVAALGAALVLAREITYGAWLSWHPLNYISVAHSLLDGAGFVTFSGGAYTMFPPLYPLLLASASLGVFDPRDVAGPLNAAIFGLTIFAVGQYLRRRLKSRFLALWAGLAAALFVPLAELAVQGRPVSLLILLATFALIQTDKFLTTGKTSALVWAAVFSALAWQTRYIGVAVPAAVGLALLFQPGATLRQRAGRVAAFSLIAALPMALWLLRNYLAYGVFTGNRRPVDYSLPALLWDAMAIVWRWVADFDRPLAAWASIALLAAIVAVALPSGCRCLRAALAHRRNRLDWHPVGIFGGFALVYFGLLIAATMLGNTWHGVQARFLIPLYIPFLVVAAFALDKLLSCERERRPAGKIINLPIIRTVTRKRQGVATPGLPALILMLALCLWLAGQVPLHANRIIQANSDDPGGIRLGYSAPRWADSETLRYIRENPISGIVYSNLPILVYFNNEGTATYRGIPLNRARGYIVDAENAGSLTGPEQLAAWLARAPDGAYLVWFKDASDHDYGLPDLRASPALEPVAQPKDGLVLKVHNDLYRTAYERIVSGAAGAPAGRATFTVYRDGTGLAYLKDPCAAADIKAMFFLHLIPKDATDLPARSRQHGFENRDFSFQEYGTFEDGRCLALIPLPDYEIARIKTGQYTPAKGQLWKAEFPR